MKTKLSYQSYGSSILIFINGETREDVLGKYLSLWNWNCTSSEPEFVTENVISVWSTLEKFQSYLAQIRLNELVKNNASKYKGLPGGAARDAWELADQDFANVAYEPFRSINSQFTEHSFGTICAEKPDDSFSEICVKHAYSC